MNAKTFKYALKRSLPILIGWIPVALAYGVMMANAGYSFLWTFATSTAVYAGSLQFLMVSFFTGTASYLVVTVMALLINSRHIFYGLSFLEKFRDYGLWKGFLIFTMSDEAYSLHCSAKPEDGVDEKWAHIFTGGLVISYWIVLSTLGTLLGSFIPFDMTGVDFSMTALFTVILVDQLRESKNRLPALCALASSAVCLAVIGAENFILPSLFITTAALVFMCRKDEKDGKEEKNA